MDRISKIEEMMDKFRSVQTKQENEKNEINEILAAKDKALAGYIERTDKKLIKDLEAINSQIAEKTLRINKYKIEIEELINPSKKSETAAFHQEIDGILNDASVIEAYNKEISEMEEEIHKFEKDKETKQKRAEELKAKNKNKTEKEKQDLIGMSNETPETRKEKQKELNLANDEARKDLTMEKAAIEKDIKKVDLKLQQVLMEMEDFTYEYELDEKGNEDRSKIKNGHEYSELDKKYKELTDEKNELKTVSELCDKYLEELTNEYEKQFQTVNEMLKTEKEKNNEETQVEQTMPEQTMPEQTIPEQTIPEQTMPEQPAPEQTIPEQAIPEQTNIDIKVSAKDNKVYINGEVVNNFTIDEALSRRKWLFRELEINGKISKVLKTKNPLKIFNISRKMDPVIIESIIGYDDKNYSELIKAYIGVIENNGNYFSLTNFNISYDLTESSLDASMDKRMQKYARYANEIEGIEVIGLKETGIIAWFKNIMDKLNTPKLDKAKTEPVIDNDLQTQQEYKSSQRNVKDEVKYRQSMLNTYIQSYEQISKEPEFDVKLFIEQARKNLSPVELNELGKVMNDGKMNGGFKEMDQKVLELQAKNEEKLKKLREDDVNKPQDMEKTEKVEQVEKNELYDAAVQAVLVSGIASTSTVQRALRIGYTKAAELIDKMEEQGIISAFNTASGGRDILITTQSNKTQEGQALSEKYKATVDHEKALENCETKQELGDITEEREETI